MNKRVGQGLNIGMLPLLGVVLLWLIFIAPSFAATPTQINDARNHSIAWLLDNQQRDGSWYSADGSIVQTTYHALLALKNAGVTSYAYARGLSWLSNAEGHSTDAIAHQVLGLSDAGMDTQSLINKLLSLRNSKNAWGAYANYETSFPDTPLAMSAVRSDHATYLLERSRLLSGLCTILSSQKSGGTAATNGSWSYNESDVTLASSFGSAIVPTVLNLLEVNAFSLLYGNINCGGVTYNLNTVVSNGIDWLLTKQSAGGFGDNAVTVLETALAYNVIQIVRPSDASLTAAQDYLINNQSADGSWQGDALSTAMSLATLPTATLSDTDGDGLPDGVETYLGTSITVADSRQYATGNGQSIEGVTASYNFVATYGAAFTDTLQAFAGNGSYTWAILSGGLPTGLTLNTSTGAITGTSNVAGTYNFSYSVTDSSGVSVKRTAQITINTAPQFSWPGNQINDEGTDVSLDMGVSDVDNDVLTYSASGLPTDLELNSATGIISGVLGYQSVGNYTGIIVSVTDDHTSISRTFNWTINNTERAPVMVSPGDQSNREGDAIVLDLNAVELDGQAMSLTVTAGALPAGLSLDADGVIRGNISYDANTNYNITVTASDGTLNTSISFAWNIEDVNRAPVMDPIGIHWVHEDDTYTINISASDPDGGAVALVVSGATPLPSYIAFTDNGDGTAVITITPDANVATREIPLVQQSISIVAIDAQGITADQSALAIIYDKSEATHAAKISTPLGVIEVELYGDIAPNTVANFLKYVNDGDYVNSFIDQVYPGQRIRGGLYAFNGGLSIVPQDPSIVSEFNLSNVAGTLAMEALNPSDPNSASSRWAINLADNSGFFDGQQATVFGRVIRGMDIANQISSLNVTTVTISSGGAVIETLDKTPYFTLPSDPATAYLITMNPVQENAITAKDHDSIAFGWEAAITNAAYHGVLPKPIGGLTPYTYSITSGALPSGLSLNASTGEIGGVPSIAGNYDFTYSINDSVGNSANGNASIHVNSLPVITNPGPRISQEGEAIGLPILATGADAGETFTYGASTLPPGLGVNSASGLISGAVNAASAGDYIPRISVSDGSYTVSSYFLWRIEPATGLVVTTIADQTLSEGDNLVIPLTASGVSAALCYQEVQALPSFATLTDNGDGTASLTLTPGYSDAGTYAIDMQLGDNASLCLGGSTPLFTPLSISFSINVLDNNQVPSVIKPADQSNAAGDVVVGLQIVATDVENDPLRYVINNLPVGLSIDVNTGLISGTIDYSAQGFYSVTFGVADEAAGKIVTETFNWVVTSNNQAPVAVNDSVTIQEDQVISINVLANDSDINNDFLTVTSTTTPTNGTVTVTLDYSIDYTPDAEFSGSDSFTYTVSDGALTATATVNVIINNVNDSPLITPVLVQTTSEGGLVSIPISANDAEGTVLSYSATGLPPGIVINSVTGLISGSLDYSAAGTYSVAISVSDGFNTSIIVIEIVVQNTNQAPVAVVDSETLNEDSSIIINVLNNDYDDDGDIITLIDVTQGVNGSVAINGDSSITYSPNANFNGVDTFSYTISSEGLGIVSGIDIGTVNLTVLNVNDVPLVTNPGDQSNIEGDSPSLSILATDLDGDTLVYSAVGLPSGLTINSADGIVNGTIAMGSTGIHVVTVTVDDGSDQSSITFNWTVTSATTADGDVNGDGILNIKDALVAQRHVLGEQLLDASAIARGDLYPVVGDGQITLSDVLLIQQSVLAQPSTFIDSDGDLLPDDWEIDNFLNPTDNSDATIDSDGDGLLNTQERTYGTLAQVRDSDGDGVEDGDEISVGTKPTDITDFPAAISSLPITVANVGVTYQYVLQGNKLGTTFILDSAPLGLSLVTNNGEVALEWTPSIVDIATHEVTIRPVLDGSLSLSQSFILTVDSIAGDVSIDGVIGLSDVLLAQRYLLGEITLTQEQIALGDLYPQGNPDGVVTISDILLLQQRLLEGQ